MYSTLNIVGRWLPMAQHGESGMITIVRHCVDTSVKNQVQVSNCEALWGYICGKPSPGQ